MSILTDRQKERRFFMGRDLSTGSRSKNTMRELEWTYYDTVTLATATLEHRMFTAGIGVNSKMKWQTNMKIGGQIPTGERMTVTAIKTLYSTHADIASTAIASIIQMLTRTVIEVKISGADSILTMTLNELMGLPMLMSTTLVATYGSAPIFNPCFNGILKLKRPIVFAENESVEVVLTHNVASPAGLDGDWLKIGLNGILERQSS